MSKNTPQDTFNAIAASTNMAELENALSEIPTHTQDAQVELINALEKVTVAEFTADGNLSAHALDMVDGLMDLGDMFGGLDALTDEEDLFEFHAVLKAADTVAQSKGKDTDPTLMKLLNKTSALSDEDYNSMTKLSRLFLSVAREHVEDNKPAPKSTNPFRGRYNGPKK